MIAYYVYDEFYEKPSGSCMQSIKEEALAEFSGFS